MGKYKPSGGALESLVIRAPHLQSGQDVAAWLVRLNEGRARVCSIATGDDHCGTGFLVGPNRVLTNSHVIPPDGGLENFNVVFDFVGNVQRTSLPRYHFVAELARSVPREFDYVVLQLDRVPTDGRGFFRAESYQFDKVREPISVLGHPNGAPLTFTFGVVFDNNSFLGRIAYTANTAPGSSGSPVFLENWNLVALHHHGEENVNNHGIPMKAILDHLTDTGNAGLIEVA
jgi:V8-like Glu-specific endopeptidase